MSTRPANDNRQVNTSRTNNNSVSAPSDVLSSADIAESVAEATYIPERVSITNRADTMRAQLGVSSDNDVVLARPQIIASALKSRRDITMYTTSADDTVSILAAKFGVTSESIQASNNLGGIDALKAGASLVIPPVNGVAYRVAASDTVDSIASKFRAEREQIVYFNDLENAALPVGEYIVVPGGRLALAFGATPTLNVRSQASSSSYEYNGYDFGFCTWWAALRRQQLGRPIPANLGDARTWRILGAQAGLSVSNSPKVGAIYWVPPSTMSGYYAAYGHVGIVEKINSDGSLWVSDMNSSGFVSMDESSPRAGGWGQTSYRRIPTERVNVYSYIY